MGATRDFVSATVADALLPTFRRPVEDIIYETLDRRQVPTRTDFKEMRDLLNNLRGQVSGTSNGIRKVVERAEETEDLIDQLETRLNALEEKLGNLQAPTPEAAPEAAPEADTVTPRIEKLEREHVTLARFSASISAIQASISEKVSPETLTQHLEQLKNELKDELRAPEPPPAVSPEQLDTAIRQAIDALRAELASAAAPVSTPEPEAQEVQEAQEAQEEKPDICPVEDCTSPVRARGFCARHYQRWRRGTLKGNFVSPKGIVQVGAQSFTVDAKYHGAPYSVDNDVVTIHGSAVETTPVQEDQT